ncbi:hypothetical protein PV325_002230 [Microctonus aethiopoides]|nr:hypothetical protein PV325_002230 [Microctonus aethiopoides]
MDKEENNFDNYTVTIKFYRVPPPAPCTLGWLWAEADVSVVKSREVTKWRCHKPSSIQQFRNTIFTMSTDIMELLSSPQMTTVCAPMVRYSKLAFRTLVRQHNCDICFTPMILADSFLQSAKARNNEFTTNIQDEPLITQFAANNPDDLANAAELVAPYCNGVDLNCGCPQRWAIKDGYGVNLLDKPHLVRDMVIQVRNRISNPFTVSVKIRLLNDIKKSVHLCQILERAGISFLTIHARTPTMQKEPIQLENLNLIRDSIQIPIIANGDVKSLDDAKLLAEQSKCQGVMVGNGILTNPALFSGAKTTPFICIQQWLNITDIIPTNFTTVHHHLVFMLEKILPRKKRLLFNNLSNMEEVRLFVASHYNMQPLSFPSSELKPIICDYSNILQQNSESHHSYHLKNYTINKYKDCHNSDSNNKETINWQQPFANLFDITSC